MDPNRCKKLPGKTIMNKKTLFSFLFFLFVIPQTIFSYELGVITLFRNEARYLKEWIEYHRMLGVDHFLLYNDRSTDNWEEVLKPYIDAKLVEVIPWYKPEATPLFPTWQVNAYKDGFARSKENTKWLAFIDIDEFIVPKKNATILECLNEFFPSASGVYMCWRNFGTSGAYVDPGKPILTHLTKASDVFHSRNASGKSIVKVADTLIDLSWSPHQLVLKPTAQYYNGSGAPLRSIGTDLQVDPVHTSDHIVVNHYVMRDENFYRQVRVPRAISREYGEIHLLTEHYNNFNQSSDTTILEFLKKYHPDMYRTFWNGR